MPRAVWITAALVLGAMAFGLTGLKASGLATAQSFRGHPDSVAGQQVLDQHLPAGQASLSSRSAARHLKLMFEYLRGWPCIDGDAGSTDAGSDEHHLAGYGHG